MSLVLTFGKDGAKGEGEDHFTVVPTGVLRQDALQDAIYFLEDMTKSFLILIFDAINSDLWQGGLWAIHISRNTFWESR